MLQANGRREGKKKKTRKRKEEKKYKMESVCVCVVVSSTGRLKGQGAAHKIQKGSRQRPGRISSVTSGAFSLFSRDFLSLTRRKKV